MTVKISCWQEQVVALAVAFVAIAAAACSAGGQSSGDITQALADRLSENFKTKPEKVSPDPSVPTPRENPADPGYPQVTDVNINRDIAMGGDFSITLKASYDQTDADGVIIYVNKASIYIKIPGACQPSQVEPGKWNCAISANIISDKSLENLKNFSLSFAVYNAGGSVGNYMKRAVKVHGAGKLPHTSQEMQNAFGVIGATQESGVVETGAQSGGPPRQAAAGR